VNCKLLGIGLVILAVDAVAAIVIGVRLNALSKRYPRD
jgi:hypothetical protein